ncbi:MAG: TonB-dependent receptor [Pseudomonadales bacterium]
MKNFACAICSFTLLSFAPLALAESDKVIEIIKAIPNQSYTLTQSTFHETQEKFLQTPGAVSVIESSQFRDGKLSNQEDILKQVPGVWVTSQSGNDDVLLSIRGSGIASNSFGRGINSFQDGIPLGRLDNGTTNQLIDVLSTDFVEVFRGANALKLGAASQGGAINYVSKTGYNSDPLVRVEGGNFGYRRVQLATGDVIDNKDYFVSLNSLNKEGYRDHSVQENYRFNSNFGVKLNDSWETRTYLSATRARSELPGTISKAQFRSDPKQAGTYNESSDTDRNWRDLRIANKTSRVIGDERLDFGIYAKYTELDHLPTPFTGIIDNTYRQVGVSAHYENTLNIGDYSHRYLAGVRVGISDDALNRFRHADGGQTKTDQTYDASFKRKQLELYFEDTIELTPDTDVIVGLQYINAHSDFDDQLSNEPAFLACFPPFGNPACLGQPQPNANTGDDSYTADHHGINPKLGISHQFGPKQYVFANIARSTGLPSSTDLGTNSSTILDEQSAWTFELGTKGKRYKLDWDITYFYSKVKDELLDFEPAPNQRAITFNASDTIHEGVEVGLGWLAGYDIFKNGDTLRLQLTYNWSNFYFDGSSSLGSSQVNNDQLPRIPEHTAYLALNYKNGPWSISPNVRGVSRYGLTYDGSGGDAYDVDSYALLGLKVNYRHNDHFNWFVDGRNLTDKDFISDGAASFTAGSRGASVHPGEPIAVYVGFEYKL